MYAIRSYYASVLSELDMLVGKVLCYLYLSPERLANEGVFSLLDLQEEIVTLSDERQLRITSYNVCYTKLLR